MYRTALRWLRRLRLTQMFALVGAILGLPLTLLLCWQGVQLWQRGEAEIRAAHRLQRVADFTQLLHQLASRGDFGLEPCSETLRTNLDALNTLDDQIHTTLLRLQNEGWGSDVVSQEHRSETRLLLTALRQLPTRITDVEPVVWRQQHQENLNRLATVIATTAMEADDGIVVDQARSAVTWFLARNLPALVERLGALTDLGSASQATNRAEQQQAFLLHIGRLRQVEADATPILQQIERSQPKLYAEFGPEFCTQLRETLRSFDRIAAQFHQDESEASLDSEALWRASLAVRQATEKAAGLCAASLAQEHRTIAVRWKWVSLAFLVVTIISVALAGTLIFGLHVSVRRSLQVLQSVTEISPSGETRPIRAFEELGDDFKTIARDYQRTISLLQVKRVSSDDVLRRAAVAEIEARRSEEQFALISSATQEGFWDWDIRTDLVYHSPKFWKMLGYRPENIPRTFFAGFVELLHCDDRQAMVEAIDGHLDRRLPFECEFRIRSPYGDYRWFHATGQARWDDSGQPARMAGALRDVTERRLLEEDRNRFIADLQASRDQITAQAAQLLKQTEELRHAQKRAEDASRSKGEFLANMSHELRTPLTAMLGYSDLLYDEGDLSRAPRSRLEMIDTIRINGRHLLQLIDDILDLSKIEAGKMAIESIPCHPDLILDEVHRLFDLRAQAKGLQLDIRLSGLLPSAFLCDPVRLRQILVNLVSNAIKFTEKGRVTLELAATRGERADLKFTVTDTGIGMTSEHLGRVFQSFGQADASTTRKFGGTGLGLSISQRLAGLLNGSLTVASESGRGSTFTVMIHANVPNEAEWRTYEPEPLPLTPTAEPMAASKSVLDGARILIADDVEPNRRLIGFVLSKAQAVVTYVENGAEAIDKIAVAEQQDQPFDIILMDMQMPVLDGYLATRQLRNNGYRGPIIAMTARAMTQDRQECLDAGCDDYLTKPIDRTALLEVCTHFRFAVRTIPASAR